MIAGSPRHEMEMHVRLGADKDGIVRGIDLYTLSNTGAYGEHGPTTVGLSGHKSIPLYARRRGVPVRVRRCIYQPHVLGRVPRLRRDAGPLRRGVAP